MARRFHPESVESILVIRLYFIGDVLLSTPVIEALGRRFPDARLTVLVKKRCGDILTGNPYVDEVMVYDNVDHYHSPLWIWRLARELRRRRFSLSVDLTGDQRSSWMVLAADPAFRVGVNHAGMGFLLDRRTPYRATGHVVDHLLTTVESLGATLSAPAPRMYLTDEERAAAGALLADVGVDAGSGVLALSPGANWPFRRWRPERFGELAALARERLGLASVVLGSSDDAGLAEAAVASSSGAAVSLAGRTSPRGLAAVLEEARAFVGSDSGPMHIAAAVGTPVIGLFGPNTPERFGPRGAPSRVLWKRFACSPCSQKKCVRPNGTCMDAITVGEVLHALESLLSEEASR